MEQTYRLQPEANPLSCGGLLAESQLTCRVSVLLLVSYQVWEWFVMWLAWSPGYKYSVVSSSIILAIYHSL